MIGKIYIVATPIGNLEDISLRAIKVLSEVDIILAEDTRVTGKLLTMVESKLQFLNNLQPKTYNLKPKLISYHQHSGEVKLLEILNFLLAGKNIALVSDAGTPGISDPGGELIEYLLSYQKDLEVIPIPGASAATALLSVSGIDVSKHLFLGFWPKKKVNKLIELIKLTKLPFVYYDSPHRVVKNLLTIEKALGESKRVVVGRELTKMHETVYRGTIKEVKQQLEKKGKVKGELVVIVDTSSS